MAVFVRVLALVAILHVIPSVYSSCQKPVTPQEAFACDVTDIRFFQQSLPATWWNPTFPNAPVGPPFENVGPADMIQHYYSCCRHCVWSLEYPFSAPIVSSGGQGQDCAEFKGSFDTLDKDASRQLDRTEFAPWFAKTANKFLKDHNMLNPDAVFTQADFDRSGSLSLEEYYVLEHFWAVTHVAKTGPIDEISAGRDLKDGPLGGFFLDQPQISIWRTNTISRELEKYIMNGWDTSVVRDITQEEAEATFKRINLDDSSRVSIEEHYFKHFADQNGDGWVSKDEYYLSLYKTANVIGIPDSIQIAPANFRQHDWNGDGRVTFLERKFIAADTNNDLELTKEEWDAADFADSHGPFEGHARSSRPGSPPTVSQLRFFYYLIFHTCANAPFDKSASNSSWARSCVVDIKIQQYPPFVTVELNTTKTCDLDYCNVDNTTVERSDHKCNTDMDCNGGRGCSYFGFCRAISDLIPLGNHLRKQHYITPPSGFSIEVLEEAMKRLRYNYTISAHSSVRLSDVQAPYPSQRIKFGWIPNTELVLTTSYEQMHLTPDPIRTPIDTHGYACSKPLWGGDGFVLVVREATDAVFSMRVLWNTIVSPSMINFFGFIIFVTIGFAHGFWWLERKENDEHFRKEYSDGIWDAIWYSFATMSTCGFGDKYPCTGWGQALASVWILFSIVCFGIYTGVTHNYIAKEFLTEKVIDIQNIQTEKVGVLAYTQPDVLASIFSFRPVEHENMGNAMHALLNRDINSILVPHAEYMNFKRESGFEKQECGVPFRIVGEPLLQSDPRFMLQNAVCACDTCDRPIAGTSVYHAQYLTEAMSGVVQGMRAEGFMREREARLTDTEPDSDGQTHDIVKCSAPRGLDVGMIVALVMTIVLYLVFRMCMFGRWTREYMLALQHMFMRAFDRMLFLFGLKKIIPSYLTAEEQAGELDDGDLYTDDGSSRLNYLQEYVLKMQSLTLGRTEDIKDLHEEVTGTSIVVRRMLIFTSSSLGVFCIALYTVFFAIVVVWGTQYRPSIVGTSDAVAQLPRPAGSSLLMEL